MSRMLGSESGMTRDMGRSHGCMHLLLIMACISLTVSDGPTCPMEILENTTVDIKPAVTKGARGDDPVYMDTEESCIEECCSSKAISGSLNCTLVIFDSRKTGNHPNCYLFHCPTDEACPAKPTAGVTSYRVIRGDGKAAKSVSNTKNKKTTYVNVNKKKPVSIDSEPSDAKKMEHVNEDKYEIKSITSKILGMAENIQKQLDQMDHSLEEKQEKPVVKKKMEKPTYHLKPGTTYSVGTVENAAIQPIDNPIIEPKINSRMSTTTIATTSTTTRVLPKTTTRLRKTTRLPITTRLLKTTRLPTTIPLPTTTFLLTTTPLITTKLVKTSKSLPTTTITTTMLTTSSTTTTPVTTNPTIAMLVVKPKAPTLSTITVATTTSVANPFTTTSTTTTDATTVVALPATPVMKALKPTHSNPKHSNNKIYKVTTSKVSPSTRAPELTNGFPRSKTPLVRPQTVTTRKATETQASSRTTPQVVAEDTASLQNVNKDLHGAKNKILENYINSEAHSADSSGLVAALVFGVTFFAVVLFFVVKRGMEAIHRRHYSRLDYLINGMYIDT